MVIDKDSQQVEVGLIPDDWDLLKFDDVFEFLDHKRKPIEEKIRNEMHGEYPYYGASGIIDYVNDYIFDDELILLGEDGENIISRNLRLAFKISGKCWVNNHAHVLKPLNGYDVNFLAELLESLNYEKYNSGTAQPKLNKQTIAKIKLVIPPLPEQQIISKNLFDINELIKQLSYLIKKKKNIKQGAMQELLTGKRRLEGFDDEWEEYILKDIVKIPVTDGPHETPFFLDDGIPFLSVNNIVNNKIDISDLRYISKKDHERFSKKCKPMKGDILLGKAASVGHVAIVDFSFEFNIWSPLALIRINDKNITKFIYYYIQSQHIKNQINFLTNSSSQGNLGMGDIEKLELFLPSKKEQLSISHILHDMDNEIFELTKKRNKYINLKQGMMQKLLTGEIRLV